MLRQQQRHLAWSGQALVANSVSIMEEAVDQIRATFLFTSKELKCALRHSCVLLNEITHRAVSPTRGIHAIKEPGLLTISWLLPT